MCRKLRVHHLLCIPLFVGEGYSGSFCENMSQIKNWLQAHPDQELTLVCEPDDVCVGCPNLEQGIICRNTLPEKDGQEQGVNQKDRELAGQMGIRPGGRYGYGALLERARSHLTKEIFETSCSNCQWYQQGLCSFEEWQRRAGVE